MPRGGVSPESAKFFGVKRNSAKGGYPTFTNRKGALGVRNAVFIDLFDNMNSVV